MIVPVGTRTVVLKDFHSHSKYAAGFIRIPRHSVRPMPSGLRRVRETFSEPRLFSATSSHAEANHIDELLRLVVRSPRSFSRGYRIPRPERLRQRVRESHRVTRKLSAAQHLISLPSITNLRLESPPAGPWGPAKNAGVNAVWLYSLHFERDLARS
jgi:hypothetical protein